MHQNLPEALDRICAYSPGLTPNRLLARAGLEPPERRLVLLDLGLSRRSGEPLTRAELVNLHAALNRCPPFLALARLHSRMALPGLTGYLRQEGLTDPVPDAVVDSGWTGTLQQSLSDACALIGRSEPVTGFYFGLYTLPRGARRETYHCYLFAPGIGLREKVRFGNNLFEAIMTAPHGTTTHYVQSDGGFLPVYAPMAPEQRERIEHFGDLMLRYVRAFLDTQSAADFLGADFTPRRRVIRRLMAQWMVRPTQAEAVCFGTLPFSDDVLPGAERDLAPPPGAGLLPRSEPWHAGSRARFSGQTGPTLRYTLYQYARHGRDLLRGGRGARP